MSEIASRLQVTVRTALETAMLTVIWMKERAYYILTGSHDPAHEQEAAEGRAPRIDYRLLAERLGGVVIEGAPSPSQLPGAHLVAAARSLLANGRIATRLIRSIPTGSVIYATGETWGLPCALLLRLTRKKEIYHIMFVHAVFSRNWRRLLRLLRPFLRVDLWLCVTENQRRALTRMLGEQAQIELVGQGVDTEFFRPQPAGTDAAEKPYILSVGMEMRDYHLLFEAVRPLNERLIVRASSRWMNETSHTNSDVPANTTFLERRLSYEEMRDLYAGAKIVVVPLKDTLQAAGITTILEAMAMQKTVIATSSAGLPDLLINEKTGYVVEPNAAALSKVIQEALIAGDHNGTVANQARAAVQQKASFDQYLDRLASLMQTIPDKRRIIEKRSS